MVNAGNITDTCLDSRLFQRQFMMPPAMFDELLSAIGLRVGRANSNWRQAIDRGQTDRLAVALC